MSRTYRRYTDSYFRNPYHRHRIVAEKASHEAESAYGDEYNGIEKHMVTKLSIRCLSIPPDPWDDIRISGASEIYMPTPDKTKDISLTARRFMKNHKCTFGEFKYVFYESPKWFDSKNSLNKDVIFMIGSG
jgi:hypothetical protein